MLGRVQFENEEAIDVDDALDELTELIVIPKDSPVTAVRRAIVLRKQRPALIVLPEDVVPRSVTRPSVPAPKPSSKRTRELTPFASRARATAVDDSEHKRSAS